MVPEGRGYGDYGLAQGQGAGSDINWGFRLDSARARGQPVAEGLASSNSIVKHVCPIRNVTLAGWHLEQGSF